MHCICHSVELLTAQVGMTMERLTALPLEAGQLMVAVNQSKAPCRMAQPTLAHSFGPIMIRITRAGRLVHGYLLYTGPAAHKIPAARSPV